MKYSDNPIEDELFHRTHRLMEEYEHFLCSNNGVYSLNAHQCLMYAHFPYLGDKKRQIILPMPREKWYPSNACLDLENFHAENGTLWPSMSHYNYSMDSCINEFPGLLCFGYAVCAEELFPCAFFVNFLLTGEIPGSDDKFPEEWAIDPMGIASGKKPECYIGVSPKIEDVQDWILSKTVHPLEAWAKDRNSDILESRNIEKEIYLYHQSVVNNLEPGTQEQYIKWLDFS
ncbi:MAG: hypothetical protein WC011_00330 [Candidatus Paceibacterota bacterium]